MSGIGWDFWIRIFSSFSRVKDLLGKDVLLFRGINARGVQISGARGLEQATIWEPPSGTHLAAGEGTLLEFFADRGAVLDEEQKRLVAEARQEQNTVS